MKRLKTVCVYVCISLLVGALAPFAFAQLASGDNPEAVADAAVEAWLERAESFDYFALAQQSPEAMCQELTVLGQDPRIIQEATVNLDDRRELSTDSETDSEDVRRYSYSARLSDSLLGSVQVRVVREGDTWQAQGVRLRINDAGVGLPDFMRSSTATTVFVLLSVYLVYLLARPSWFRRWLAEGYAVLKDHRRITLGTIIALYGVYTLGSLAGTAVPECQEALATIVGGSLEDTGVVDIVSNGNIPQTAAVITYWNFIQGAILTTFSPAFLFGIPAYLINLARFFVLGFALAPVGPQAALLVFHVPVIVIELLAYILVTAGGGIFLATLIRQGFSGFRQGVRRLALTVPIALVLLTVGAWYESAEILWLIPLFMGN
ncbi:MAG: stage II sporulation protein M [Trueperaceae bacterium]|nr:stage II sporulation protein M [Trueperaceae bacterium]